METQSFLYIIFALVIGGFLVADLGYFNRKAHRISAKSALIQSIFWITIALGFSFLVLHYLGRESQVQFLSAYVTEKMLSVDNLFVILLIFNFFKLEEIYHHKVLFWGILGAIVLRGIFIGAGSLIVSEFHWVLYVFGAILLYTGIRLFRDKKEEHVNFHENRFWKFLQKYLPLTADHHGGRFWTRKNGRFYFTLLFAIVLLVEATDIVFAIDSVPAAFAITQKPFIVFTSNIFAIMGLRALFFLIENILHRFHHLQKGLAFILVFIGAKMLAGIFHIHLSSLWSFAVIMLALGLSLLASVVFPKKI